MAGRTDRLIVHKSSMYSKDFKPYRYGASTAKQRLAVTEPTPAELREYTQRAPQPNKRKV